jgi:hypothetical protein
LPGKVSFLCLSSSKRERERERERETERERDRERERERQRERESERERQRETALLCCVGARRLRGQRTDGQTDERTDLPSLLL